MTKGKNNFTPVDPKINFPEEEKKLIKEWYKKGIVKKYLDKNKDSKKYFSFIDGPITANNPMGVHHAWGRTYKDLWQRYKNMQGYKQRFQNGFDAQGLWVEVEVEKELGFKNKKDIEKFGVEKFVQLCRDRVKKYSEIQTEQSKRLGYFMDWDHSYYTLSTDNNYMIWHFLKKVYEEGWLYKGKDSVAWCPRCETAISQHEMLTEDYKEVTHESVYMAFPIMGREEEYLMVWTTTPWTIPANISVAVDENLTYAKIEVNGKKYWLAKEAIQRVMGGAKYVLIKETTGAKLVGLRYKGAFDDLPAVSEVSQKFGDKFHSVIATDNQIMPITTTEGTGMVHTAVSAGTEDFKLGKKLGLPMIPVIEDDASYTSNLGFLTGLNAKKNPRVILDYLETQDNEGRHFVYKIEKYTHRYPACWRCKTELVWKVTDEWYISMDKEGSAKKKDGEEEPESENKNTKTLRQRMINVANKIGWIPEFGLDRELDWLNNMHDWLISKKNRYWGLALPIYDCKNCGKFQVVGSYEELKEKAIEGWADFEGHTPHKPYIDKVKIKCSKCGQTVERIEPVGNPWLDAGIVPYSTVSDNNKAANFETTKARPLYLTNTKEWNKWVPASFITESFPGQFKNWFYSLIAMSTVLEDKEPFKTVLGYATCVAEDGRPMHKSWGNSIEFNEGADKIGVDVMRWMYVRQNPAENLLFGYRVADEVRRKFHLTLWNIYNFFITYANLDEWSYDEKKHNSNQVGNVLDGWLIARLRETIVGVTKSLDKYDARSGAILIEDFVSDMSLWYIRRSRERVDFSAEDKNDKNAFYQTTHIVLLNLSKILAPFTPFMSEMIFKNLTSGNSVHLAEWPDDKHIKNLTTLLKADKNADKILAEMKIVRLIVEKGHAIRKEKNIAVKQPLQSTKVTIKQKLDTSFEKLVCDELNVKKVIWETKDTAEISVKLDTKITPDLEEEAKSRDLIRKIQGARKEMGVKLTDKVDVANDWLPTKEDLVKWVTKKAQVSSLEQGVFKVSLTKTGK